MELFLALAYNVVKKKKASYHVNLHVQQCT